MSVLQKTPIRSIKRFPTAMHSGKMYIRHLVRYGQLFTTRGRIRANTTPHNIVRSN